MSRRRSSALNVEILAIGPQIIHVGYRRLKWYVKKPPFERYVPI